MEISAEENRVYRILYDGCVVMELDSPITIDDIKQAARQEGLGVVVVYDVKTGKELETEDFPFAGDVSMFKAAKGN